MNRITLSITCLVLCAIVAPSIYALSPTTDQPVDPEASTSSIIENPTKKSGIEINPAVMEVEISNVEEEKTVNIQVVNYNNYAVNLDLAAINFKQGDLDGLVQFLGEKSDSYTYSLSSFIHMPYSEIELEAHEKRDIEVQILNRQDLSPGGHYAGIVVRQKPQKNLGGKTYVLPAVSSLILLKKTGGEEYNLSIKEVDWPERVIEFFYSQKVTITFQNEGNVHLVPYGRVEVRDVFGRLIKKGVINTSSAYVFPSSRRRIEIDMKPISLSLPISVNTVTIRGNDSIKKTHFNYQEAYVYINPIFIIALIILPFVIKWYRSKRRKK